MDARKDIGQRIARARRRRGLSQTVLAGLIGRSESWLSQVERGRRSMDSHTVINALTEILGLPVDDLTATKADAMTPYQAAVGIRQAMMGYDGLSSLIDPGHAEGSPESLVWLRHEIRQVNRLYQATRYDEVGQRLPRLIVATELGSRHTPARHRRAYQTLRSLTYHCTTTTLRRVGEAEPAWMAADRSLAAAEEAEKPLLVAVSAYRLGYVFVRLREPDKALQLALRAVDALGRSTRRSDPRPLSVFGALHLVAVTAAAARYDHTAVRAFLERARRTAEHIGHDRNDFWTAFGLTNVTIHEVSAAVESGDPRQAISKGETLNTTELAAGLVGRRAQVHLDLARAYAAQRKDAAAVNMLLEAERLSPQLVRYGGRTRDLLTQLLKREHRASTPQLRGLAARAGIA
ncbi:transcriptional regulator [Planomonospora parontospora subsp. parontospora]|uniref:Transcriptional regulator n=2 Tax=Planomonospora parontospora TaxID=58119 RepID=A0AA37F7P3_9ACTN|nr:helix-turn-helix transcriptional regulator [Planomonospora parontospora]GGK94862.1 transcriptional regulator [Planomonospora parontospora]GII12527.1 transcriptional regulator [Planomonospora parontospora subsp. parontospora]